MLLLKNRPVEGAGGGKGGSSSGRQPVEAANTLQSSALAKFIDLLSEGEIGGLVDEEKSVFFNKVQARNADDTQNFKGFKYQLNVGMSDQAYLEGFEDITSEYSVGLRVRADNPAEWVSNGNELDAAVITVNVPALTKLDKTTGDMNGYHIALAIDVMKMGGAGSWVERVNYDYIQGKNTSPYERSYRIQFAQPGQYAIRVRRLSPDTDNDSTIQDTLYFQSVTEIIEQKMMYSDSAVIGVQIDAEQFDGNVASRAYEIYGMKCRYPSNYNPVTRTYTGFWDGTWSYGYQNNPAWIFYAMATHPRYGAGIDEALVDRWGLYDLARYSDELVSDGQGGLEPRFVFNGVIASREEAYRVLQGIASMMRAIVFYSAGAAIIRQDKPQRDEEKRSFTKANVIGEFNYSSTAKKARHTSANVQWVNPALGYEKDFVMYEDRAAIMKFGSNPLNIAAYGTTSRGQAYRLGKWSVLTDLLQTETVQFVAGWDAADILPGDIIEVADPHWATADFGGRISSISADGRTVVLDRKLSMTGATTPQLHLTLVKGEVDDIPNPGGPEQDRPIPREMVHFTSNISAYNDATKTVTLTTPVPTDYLGDRTTPLIWVFSKDQVKPREFKVFSQEERDGKEFKIAAINYSPEKFAAMDFDYNIEIDGSNPWSDLPQTGSCVPPTNLKAEFVTSLATGIPKSSIVLSWDASTDHYLRGYVLTFRRGLNNPVDVPMFLTSTFTIEDATPGLYTFSVRAVNRFGAYSSALTLEQQMGNEASNKDLIYNLQTTVSPISFDNSLIAYTGEFIGRDCEIAWESLPLSRLVQSGQLAIRVVRPNVGEVQGFDASPGTALPQTFSTAGMLPGDQVEVTVGSFASFSFVMGSETAAQFAAIIGARIEQEEGYDAEVSGVVVTVDSIAKPEEGVPAPVTTNTLKASDDPFFKQFRISVYDTDGSLLRTEYTTTEYYKYDYDKNLADNTAVDPVGNVTPSSKLRFLVAVEDIRGNISNDAILWASNSQIPLEDVEIEATPYSIRLKFSRTTDPDYIGILVWVSENPDFERNASTLRWSDGGQPVITALPDTQYYLYYAFYDAFYDPAYPETLNVSDKKSIRTLKVEAQTIGGLTAEEILEELAAVSAIGEAFGDNASEKIQEILEGREDIDDVVDAILRLSRSANDLEGYVRNLGFSEGEPIGPIVRNEIIRTDTLVSTLDLIGVKSENGFSFILDIDTVKLSEDESLSERFSLVSASLGDNAAAITEEALARATAISAEANLREALALVVGNNRVLYDNTVTALINADIAEANLRTELGLRVGDAESLIIANNNARITQDNIFAQTFNLLGAKNGAGSAFILNESTTQVGTRGSMATVLNGIQTQFNGVTSQFTSIVNLINDGDGFVAELVEDLRVELEDDYASITYVSGIRNSLEDDIDAVVSLAINVNGRITGYRVSGATSSFVIAANNFAVATTSAGASYFPFTISGGKITLTGDVSVNGGLLVGGTVTAASIISEGITRSVSSTTGGAQTLSTGFSEIQSATITTRGGRLETTVTIFVDCWHPSAGDATFYFEIYRNGTTVFSDFYPLIGGDFFFGSIVIPISETLGAGTYTYSAAARVSTTDMTNRLVKNRNIRITEFLR